jgi:hypothetical protein
MDMRPHHNFVKVRWDGEDGEQTIPAPDDPAGTAAPPSGPPLQPLTYETVPKYKHGQAVVPIAGVLSGREGKIVSVLPRHQLPNGGQQTPTPKYHVQVPAITSHTREAHASHMIGHAAMGATMWAPLC